MSKTLHAELRETSTRGELRQLRKDEKVPGVVYGKSLDEPTPISLGLKELKAMLKSNPHAVVDMQVPGIGKLPVMMAELQKDAMSRELLHVDFQRINMNEKIHTSARLEMSGQSPGEKEGGMLQMVTHELEITCYPKDIPDSIKVDVSDLQIGDHLTIGELKLPAGVEVTQDAEMVIVAVLAPQKERTEEEVDALEDKAEEERKHSEAAQAVETN
jgi:large subunit ribosomal protein L25